MKTATTLEAAVAMIPDGATLMIGGFFGVGTPHRLIQGLASAGRQDLIVIANDTVFPGTGIVKVRFFPLNFYARCGEVSGIVRAFS